MTQRELNQKNNNLGKALNLCYVLGAAIVSAGFIAGVVLKMDVGIVTTLVCTGLAPILIGLFVVTPMIWVPALKAVKSK